MAIVNFLFGNRSASGFKLGSFQADMTISEGHEFTAEATEFPVEDRKTATDSIIKAPKSLTLVGFVTETPAAPLSFFNRKMTDIFKTLEELYDKSEPITVTTAYKVYDNMIITRILLPREQPASMEFTVELQHATILSPVSIAIPNLADSVKDIAAGLADGGKQTGVPSSPATENAAQSILSRFL
jgi:hypothetical protein